MTQTLPLALPLARPFSLPPLRLTAHRPTRLVLRSAWSPTLVWLAGVALCVLMALASLPRAAWTLGTRTSPVSAAVTAPAAAAPDAPQPTARLRCAHCGVVELIRRMEPSAGQPADYELTVRLRNGSARVSTIVAATASAWAVGDPIMLLGGI